MAAEMTDHLHDAHAVSMIRSLRGAQGRVLVAILDSGPHDAITIEGNTTAECLDRLHARLTPREVRATMTTLPDHEEGGL